MRRVTGPPPMKRGEGCAEDRGKEKKTTFLRRPQGPEKPSQRRRKGKGAFGTFPQSGKRGKGSLSTAQVGGSSLVKQPKKGCEKKKKGGVPVWVRRKGKGNLIFNQFVRSPLKGDCRQEGEKGQPSVQPPQKKKGKPLS